MKKILVPVDFSEFSEYALEVAAQLAKKHEAGIIILHMIGLSDSVLANSEIAEEQEARYYLKMAKEKIKEFTEKAYLEEISVEAIIQNYKEFTEVNKVAHEQDCDLVVMGSHGSSGLSELFVGSNTEKVVRTSDVPVLVVKKRHETIDIKKMVFACDMEKENVSAYKKAAAFADMISASLEVVYVNTAGANFLGYDDVKKRIAVFKKELGVAVKVNFYNYHTVERGILNYCAEHNADLLVMPTHGRRGLAHFVVGSLAESVANHAKIPVMTVKF
ncbi:MAG: universal stress protein [Muricauda sp.]|nr:universal stress protein [Allomuricauda sp.]